METVKLDAPDGIDARLGWDPAVSEHDRKRQLARELIVARLHVDPKDVRITREAPAQFGFHTQLEATTGGSDEVPVPLEIRTTSFRAATVVTVSEPGIAVGIDIRDHNPDEATLRDMRRHSKLWEGTSDEKLLDHWTRVQAVLHADGRGPRVHPEHVRLDPSLEKGWIPDRPVFYKIADLSRQGFVITLAYGPVHD
jgi:4'-phosphopantetheinyl transferase